MSRVCNIIVARVTLLVFEVDGGDGGAGRAWAAEVVGWCEGAAGRQGGRQEWNWWALKWGARWSGRAGLLVGAPGEERLCEGRRGRILALWTTQALSRRQHCGPRTSQFCVRLENPVFITLYGSPFCNYRQGNKKNTPWKGRLLPHSHTHIHIHVHRNSEKKHFESILPAGAAVVLQNNPQFNCVVPTQKFPYQFPQFLVDAKAGTYSDINWWLVLLKVNQCRISIFFSPSFKKECGVPTWA